MVALKLFNLEVKTQLHLDSTHLVKLETKIYVDIHAFVQETYTGTSIS